MDNEYPYNVYGGTQDNGSWRIPAYVWKVQGNYTRESGDSWNDVSGNIKGLPAGSWIAQIKASKNNKGEALLVANNYRRFDYRPYVFRTTNYGKT